MLGDEGQRDHSVVVSLLRITYDPAEPESVVVEVDACTGQCVGGVSEGLIEQNPIGGSSPGAWESRRPEDAWVRFL